MIKNQNEKYHCEFCEKSYSSKSNLKTHQSTSKKCIEQRPTHNDKNSVIESNVICQYCDKSFTNKYNKGVHESSCRYKEIHEKYNSHIRDLETKLENLIKDHKNEIDLLNEKHKREISEQKAELYLSSHKKYMENAEKNQQRMMDKADKDTISINNYRFSNRYNPLDLSVEKMSQVAKEKFTRNHYEQGIKGQMDWLLDHGISDDQGILKIICTDEHRKLFRYKDINGNMMTDIGCKKLAEIHKLAIKPIIDLYNIEYISTGKDADSFIFLKSIKFKLLDKRIMKRILKHQQKEEQNNLLKDVKNNEISLEKTFECKDDNDYGDNVELFDNDNNEDDSPINLFDENSNSDDDIYNLAEKEYQKQRQKEICEDIRLQELIENNTIKE